MAKRVQKSKNNSRIGWSQQSLGRFDDMRGQLNRRPKSAPKFGLARLTTFSQQLITSNEPSCSRYLSALIAIRRRVVRK